MTEIVFGPSASAAPWLAAHGSRRALILCGAGRRFVEPVVAALSAAGVDSEVFDGARVHVPEEVVAAAEARLAACSADGVIAIGGGSPIGLGKVLRLRHGVRFVAIPTTYAGSERTTLYGITRARDKQTGRDERVRPELIVYDVALAIDLPIALTVQSLCNAIAHVVSVLSTGSLAAAARGEALAAAHDVAAAIGALLDQPRDPVARELAARAASACAVAADRGKPGAQHGLAHLLGGALGAEHAALHSILLPSFVAYLRETQPALAAELEAALGHAPLDAWLRAALARAGAPATLAALGATAERVEAALATRPELPAQIARAAL